MLSPGFIHSSLPRVTWTDPGLISEVFEPIQKPWKAVEMPDIFDI